jgi:hypothetical protein
MEPVPRLLLWQHQPTRLLLAICVLFLPPLQLLRSMEAVSSFFGTSHTLVTCYLCSFANKHIVKGLVVLDTGATPLKL